MKLKGIEKLAKHFIIREEELEEAIVEIIPDEVKVPEACGRKLNEVLREEGYSPHEMLFKVTYDMDDKIYSLSEELILWGDGDCPFCGNNLEFIEQKGKAHAAPWESFDGFLVYRCFYCDHEERREIW